MKYVKMRELAKLLGISRETLQKWVEKDPTLGVRRKGRGKNGGVWWLRLDKIADRAGVAMTDVLLLEERVWIRATTAAKLMGVSRFTMRNWCTCRPGFAKRLGRTFYIDVAELGATDEQMMVFRANREDLGANRRA